MVIASTTTLDVSMVGVLVATAIVAASGTPGVEVPTTHDLQVAVLSDGFAVMDGAPGDRHVVTVNREGAQNSRRAVPVIATDARMVGTPSGPAIGWVERDKLHFARVTGDGELGEVSRWGKRVKELCYGSVRDENQYGVGWLEADGSVWVLFGAMKQQIAAVSPPPASATRTAWCAVTGAGSKVALVWGDQRNRVEISVCDSKRCSIAATVPVARSSQLERIACHDTRCAMVVKDARGAAGLGWFELATGKLRWAKPLADAAPGTSFSIAAAGPNAFVVGYATREGATAVRVIESGSMVRAWADPYAQEAPALAWASDVLLVAHRHASGAVPEVVPLPR